MTAVMPSMNIVSGRDRKGEVPGGGRGQAYGAVRHRGHVLENMKRREERGREVPSVWIEIMERCWSESPKERPTFSRLIKWFERLNIHKSRSVIAAQISTREKAS